MHFTIVKIECNQFNRFQELFMISS
jgi:hypothetical protein